MRLHAIASSGLLVAILATACAPSRPVSVLPADWRHTDKAPVTLGERAMVVSSHPIASTVGRDIIRAGGNAVDAAVAVGFALAGVHPAAGNNGAGSSLGIRLTGRRTCARDYRATPAGC